MSAPVHIRRPVMPVLVFSAALLAIAVTGQQAHQVGVDAEREAPGWNWVEMPSLLPDR